MTLLPIFRHLDLNLVVGHPRRLVRCVEQTTVAGRSHGLAHDVWQWPRRIGAHGTRLQARVGTEVQLVQRNGGSDAHKAWSALVLAFVLTRRFVLARGKALEVGEPSHS
jgi:hypothetical protein